MPPAPKPRRSRVWLFVGTVVALAVVLASAGIGALYLHGGGLTFPWAVSTPTPQEVVLLRDPLTSNAHGWPVQFGACEFANGGYQISNDFICFAPGPDYPNVDVIVQVRQIGGLQTVPYGIVFRAGTHGNHYEFDVDGGGEWSYWKDVDGQFAPIVYWTYTRAFKWVNSGDTGATNTLEVRAKGNQFQFFINGVNVGHASDGTFSGGRVGMWCGQGGQVVYNNLVISAIP